MSKWFMLHNKKHHQVDDGIYLHYSDTCDVRDVTRVKSSKSTWARRSTPTIELRLSPSRVGFVEILYETKGVITFFAQMTPDRVAWQRIKWDPDFHKKWDDKKVEDAIENFLWVAMCELKRKKLSKEWWLD